METTTKKKSRRQPARNSQEMRDELVLNNLGLAGAQIKWLYRIYPNAMTYYPPEDVWQDAVAGLMRAAELWNPERSAFSTYAVAAMRTILFRTLEQTRLVKVPEHVLRELHRGERHDWYIAERKTICESQVGTYPTEKSSKRFLDPPARDMSVPEQVNLKEGKQWVRQLLKSLPGRYGYVIERHWLELETLDTIALRLGVTKERIRQLEVKGLKLLRKRLAGKRYQQFF